MIFGLSRFFPSRLAAYAVLVFMLHSSVHALQPARFNYQGRIAAGDDPLTGSHTFFFSLYRGGDETTPDSGENLYAESAVATLPDGILNHTVGTGTVTSGGLTADLFTGNDDLFLQVAVDTPGNVILPRHRLEPVPFAIAGNEPASLFGRFGGRGTDGTKTTSGSEVLSASRIEYESLTIPAGTTMTAVQPFTFIAVKGACVIAGGLSADNRGAGGGNGASFAAAGQGGFNGTTGRASPDVLIPCLGGAGGGGGSAGSFFVGGAGGGAGSAGSAGSGPPTEPFQFVSAGLAGSGLGTLKSDDFVHFLAATGGGGGGGASDDSSAEGGDGGAAGGVIYIECGELVFTGTVSAAGRNGFAGSRFLSGGAGGGGGGGGGVVLVRARKITTNAGTVKVPGGIGGRQAGFGVPGLDGAAGFWDIVVLP